MQNHDEFLETLTEQAKGNHQRNSVTGNPLQEAGSEDWSIPGQPKPLNWHRQLPNDRQQTYRAAMLLRNQIQRLGDKSPIEAKLFSLLLQYRSELQQLALTPPPPRPRYTNAEMNPPENLAQKHGQDWLNAPFGS